MKVVAFVLAFGLFACAQKPPKPVVTDAQRAEYWRETAQMMSLQAQAQQLMAKQAKRSAEICALAKLPADCSIDWDTGIASPKPDPVAKK